MNAGEQWVWISDHYRLCLDKSPKCFDAHEERTELREIVIKNQCFIKMEEIIYPLDIHVKPSRPQAPDRN